MYVWRLARNAGQMSKEISDCDVICADGSESEVAAMCGGKHPLLTGEVSAKMKWW